MMIDEIVRIITECEEYCEEGHSGFQNERRMLSAYEEIKEIIITNINAE